MKDTKAIFNLGMTAPEVVCKIVELNLDISAILFKIYIPTKTLEEDPVLQIQTSLNKMIRHNPPEKEEVVWLKREERLLERLAQIVEILDREKALAVTSGVKVFNTEKKFHIPMIDFSCEISSENLRKIQGFLMKIKQKGVVLRSGRSYHYYGIELLPERDWFTFLGKCLLFTGHTDSRNIGHRLIDGHSSLRISEQKRRPHLPKVVAIV